MNASRYTLKEQAFNDCIRVVNPGRLHQDPDPSFKNPVPNPKYPNPTSTSFLRNPKCRKLPNTKNTKVYMTVNVCSYINNTFGHKSTVDIISDFGLVELFEKVSTK